MASEPMNVETSLSSSLHIKVFIGCFQSPRLRPRLAWSPIAFSVEPRLACLPRNDASSRNSCHMAVLHVMTGRQLNCNLHTRQVTLFFIDTLFLSVSINHESISATVAHLHALKMKVALFCDKRNKWHCFADDKNKMTQYLGCVTSVASCLNIELDVIPI